MHQEHGRYAFLLFTFVNFCFTVAALSGCYACDHARGKGKTMDAMLKAKVDELGALKAAIAELTEKEKELKTAIAASGYAELDGDLYRATVSLSERVTLDSEKVRALLSDAQIAACSRTTEVLSVRVAARKRASGSK